MVLKAFLCALAITGSVMLGILIWYNVWGLYRALKNKTNWQGTPIIPFLFLLFVVVFLWCLFVMV